MAGHIRIGAVATLPSSPGHTRARAARVSLLAIAISALIPALGASTAAADPILVQQSIFGNITLGVQLLNPGGVGVDTTTGNVYVADTGNARVAQFDASGHFLMAWGWGVVDGSAVLQTCTSSCLPGIAGGAAGQFSTPEGVAVDNSTGSSAGDVYVLDSTNKVVDKFNSSGAYLSQLTGTGPSSPFDTPTGVAVDVHGNLWVSDSGTTNRAEEFDSAGSHLTGFADSYSSTAGIAVDSSDNVYLIDSAGNVDRWTSAGAGRTTIDSGTAATAIAVDPSTNNLYSDHGYIVYEYNAAGSQISTLGLIGGSRGLAYNPHIALPNITPGALYVADAAGNNAEIIGTDPLLPPSIDGESASGVGAVSAVVHALINPHYSSSTYFVQWGTDTSYSGGVLPAPPGLSLAGGAADATDHTASLLLNLLQAHTTYHFRFVAVNQNGTTPGPDRTFTTYAGLGAFALPDHRAFELVSPLNKYNGEVVPNGASTVGPFLEQAAPSGDKVEYESLTSFPGGARSAPIVSNYMAARSPVGWVTEPISPPRREPSVFAPFQWFSPDLSVGVLQSRDVVGLAPGAPSDYNDLYLWRDADNSYQAINTVTPPNLTPNTNSALFPGGFVLNFFGASSDLSHVFFTATDSLTPGALPNSTSFNWAEDLYEWTNGQLQLVSVLPNGAAAPNPVPGTAAPFPPDGHAIYAGAPTSLNFNHVVSNDGSRVFFTSGGQLYVRKSGISTARVSASVKTNGSGPGGSDAHGPQEADFQAASADGSKVYFTSSEELTNDAYTGVADGGSDLYEYDVAAGALTDITADSNVTDANGAGVLGVLGAGDDASYLYFAAKGKLAPGAVSGRANLYVRHAGVTTLIAPISTADDLDWSPDLISRDSAVTPDGRHLVFMSLASPTGFVNIDAITNHPDTEVYEYSADDAKLVCASCKPSNGQPVGPSSVPQGITPLLNPRYVSDDGSRVYFNTTDVLWSGDLNGKQDVYQYENGRVNPITDGTSVDDATLVSISASGNDVFFTTRESLVAPDVDSNADLYDARVGGGFPVPRAAPVCTTGEACRPFSPPAPLFGPPMSSTFIGSGNVVPTAAPTVTKAKPKAKPKKKSKAKPKAKKQAKKAKKAKRAKAKKTKAKKSVSRRAKR
ncbi:MAG TPA: hypothetical protein VLJ42_08310 [Solirubrobacteraceae bacterium]|nr:hypothetical protein [Solirubrobacteraceae bacterium]